LSGLPTQPRRFLTGRPQHERASAHALYAGHDTYRDIFARPGKPAAGPWCPAPVRASRPPGPHARLHDQRPPEAADDPRL